MLTPPDERFTHQAAFPHAVVDSSDPAWRERYWISFQDVASGATVLSCGIGQYPNQDTQEAFVCLTHEGKQRNLRLARRLSPASHLMQVGPFAVDIIEPYRTLRFTLDDNPSGVAFDLEWTGAFDPFLEDRHFETSGPRVTHDLVRYIQVGRARGRLSLPEQELAVEPATWWSERDHSWGVRPLPRREGDPPSERPAWRFLLFLPLQFETFGLHLYLFEDGQGHPTHRSFGRMGGSGDAPQVRLRSLSHDLQSAPGAPTPTLEGGDLNLAFADGTDLKVELTAREGRAHLRGGGYGGVNGWFQGRWKGEDSVEHEVWDLSDKEMVGSWGAYSSDHLVSATAAGEVGHGVAEYMVLPGHHRYGHVRERAR